jgi:hypothetical protein
MARRPDRPDRDRGARDARDVRSHEVTESPYEERPGVVHENVEYRSGDELRAGMRTVDRSAVVKTSAAAVFSLVFGLSALLAVLTLILTPLALVLSLIGIALGAVAFSMIRRPEVTGRGVAIGGLTLSIVALLLGIVVAAGVTTFLNDETAVQRLENRIQELRNDLPQRIEIPTP